MQFIQPAPGIKHPYLDDRLLRSWMRYRLPASLRSQYKASWLALGESAIHTLQALKQEDPKAEPAVTHFDPWGQRIDRLHTPAIWKAAREVAREHNLVGLAYEPELGVYGRLIQMSHVYLYAPESEFFACPLAMTDGVANVLQRSGHPALTRRALPRLTGRHEEFWTAGQWMTETTGGSDLSGLQTTARLDEHGLWRLHGQKWFVSAIDSDAALALARVQKSHQPHSGPLAVFYVEPRKKDGRWRNLNILRLKDKLGTRVLPTAEVQLNGTPAEPVKGLDNGIRTIAPLLNVSRLWNSICAVAQMRKGIALARDWGNKRVVGGQPLLEWPAFQRSLGRLQAEQEMGFHLSFYAAEMMGQAECGKLSEAENHLLRLLITATKMFTGKQAWQVTTQLIELFGGAGYVEDTGLPQLARDARVFSIWEGTSDVLSLDFVQQLMRKDGLDLWLQTILANLGEVQLPATTVLKQWLIDACQEIRLWLDRNGSDKALLQACANELTTRLASLMALSLGLQYGQWAHERESDPRPLLAAEVFAAGLPKKWQPGKLNPYKVLASDIYS